MSQEPTLKQYLEHLYNLALEANVPAKVHSVSNKAFQALSAAIEPNVKEEKKE